MILFFKSTFFDTDYLRKCLQLSLKFVCWSIIIDILFRVAENWFKEYGGIG